MPGDSDLAARVGDFAYDPDADLTAHERSQLEDAARIIADAMDR